LVDSDLEKLSRCEELIVGIVGLPKDHQRSGLERYAPHLLSAQPVKVAHSVDRRNPLPLECDLPCRKRAQSFADLIVAMTMPQKFDAIVLVRANPAHRSQTVSRRRD
jgi:hypothetical protein